MSLRFHKLLAVLSLLFLLELPSRAADVNAVFNAAADVPVTSNGYAASGAVTFTLNFAPATGTNLTVVKNTGLPFISGNFNNLAQGQVVTLNYGGLGYSFVANYYGGDGRDLVLQWANVRPMAWGRNGSGQLGNNSTTNSLVPVAVVQTSGALSGKTVTSLAVGDEFTLALCSDGTIAGWGRNNGGQLGNNTTTGSTVPVAVLQSGVLAGKTVVAVAVGAYHSMALCSDGTVATWGSNTFGQLGTNSAFDSKVPIAVDRSGVLSGKTVVAISAGMHHSLALCSDGTLAAWGWNGRGQLGNNQTSDSSVPVAVVRDSGVLLGKTVVKMTAGTYHNLVLCSDGTLAAWGSNSFGELGNNSTIDGLVPVAVTQTGAFAGKTVVDFSAAVYASIGLCSDGTVATWGQGYDGELGNDTTTASYVPIVINQFGALAGRTVVRVAAGGLYNAALCFDGALTAWGYNVAGQLGNNSTANTKVPVLVSTVALAAGERFASVRSGVTAYHTAALVASPPTPLATTLAATSITKNGATLNGVVNPNSNSSAVSFDYGLTTAYGMNVAGMPAPVTGNTSSPVSAAVDGLTPGTTYHFRVNGVNVVGASIGNDLTFRTVSDNANLSNLALSSGALSPAFSSGTTNYTANVPNETPYLTVTPTVADGAATVTVNGTPVASGSASSVVELNLGANNITVVVTAEDGVTTQTYTVVATLLAAPPLSWTYQAASDVPVTVSGYLASGTATLELNFFPSAGTNLMVIKNTGARSIRGAFTNLAQGQMVILTYRGIKYPFVVNYHGGSGNDLVLQWADQQPWAWGSNTSRQLGAGSVGNSALPVPVLRDGVLAGRTVIATAVGQVHSLALCADGTLAAWGANGTGQLGTNSFGTTSVPVAVMQGGVLSGKRVIAIAAGALHNLALCSDGTIAAWGSNSSGQLGDNSDFSRSAPVIVVQSGVLSGKKVIAIAAGTSHSLALCSDGTVAAWGSGFSGQLGNASFSSSFVPVAVSRSGVLAGKTVVAISAGASHSLALNSDGTVAAWGLGSSGQLGNSSAGQSSIPVLVTQSGVLSGKTVVSISAGGTHNLALCSDGVVAAWGSSSSGQLGNGSFASSSVPVAVTRTGGLAGKTVIAVSAGGFHSLAHCSDGTIAAWGLGFSGQLGNNSFSSSSVPLILNPPASASGGRFALVSSGSAADYTVALAASLPLPTVATLEATSITTSGATLNGTVNSQGNPTAVAFDYGTSTSYGTSVAAVPSSLSDSTATPVARTLTGLTPGVTYHYRVKGMNEAATSYGNDMTFTVLPTPLTNLDSWRQTYFPGSTATTGSGADTATPQNDGVSNLLKFATGMNPGQPGVMPGTVSVAGGNLVFTYTPSVEAVADGFVFTVEYTDALAEGLWASDIVDQGVIGAGGTPVTATVPVGSSGRRYLRLKIKSP